jgi:histidinol-phosphate aminotransferase
MTGARSIYERLSASGIIVRDRSRVILCEDCLRITVGTPEENQQLIDTLKGYVA